MDIGYWSLKVGYFLLTLFIVTVYGLLLGATIARTMADRKSVV